MIVYTGPRNKCVMNMGGRGKVFKTPIILNITVIKTKQRFDIWEDIG